MSAKSFRIIVIDDDPSTLKSLVELLEKEGHEVLSHQSARSALGMLQYDKKIDVVITEINLPETSGFQFLKIVKEDRRLQSIPIIICTTQSDPHSVRTGIELGAIDYVAKPVELQTILHKIERAVDLGPGEIMVVDDEQLLIDLLARILEREGHKVITASNGEDALEILQKRKIAMVISDIKMPGMNGLELMANIKENNPEILVLLMTGHGGTYTKDEVLAAGADGYVQKPFKNLEIINRVGSLLRSPHRHKIKAM